MTITNLISKDKRYFLTWALTLVLMFLMLLALGSQDLLLDYNVVSSAHAEQNSESNAASRKTRKTPALRQNVYKKISEAQEFSDAKDFNGALEVLNKLEKRPKLNAYEKAMVYYLKGFAFYSQDKYPDSIEAFRKIVGNESVPLEFENRVLGTLAQLYFVVENYKEVINVLVRLHGQQDKPTHQSLFALAQAYYLEKEYDRAIETVGRVMAMDRKAGVITSENTLLLLQGCHFEKKNIKQVAGILETLVELYPKKQYWIQLSAVYSQLGLDEKQMSAMELAYRQNYLSKSKEFEMLAQLYLYHALPYKAARLLEKALKNKQMESNKKNLKLLGDAWVLAKEVDKAIVALKKAAKLSKRGDIYERLVELYSEKENWTEVVRNSEEAVKKKDLNNIGRLYLLKGVAHFNLEEFESARTALKKAKKKPKTARFAKSWMRYVDREEQRAMLEESIAEQ